MARSSCCPTLFTFLTRLVGLLFLVAAALSIPEAWKLNESEYTRSENDNKTIFVPIEICDKSSITIDGQAVVFKTRSDESNDGNSNNSDCHTLEYLINACVASILFAGAATIIFFIFDLLARYHTSGPVSRSAVLGMSFFLSFILVQTAACCYALYMECDYWEEYFTERFF
jgi:hypothetical protein